MWESFFGFKKTPFSDSPDAKQLFASQAWNQVKTRLEFLASFCREMSEFGTDFSPTTSWWGFNGARVGHRLL
jgi:hypothetical protein